MADYFVDKILENEKIIGEWKKNTINIMRAYSFNYAVELFMKCADDYAVRYNKTKIPNYVFTGKKNIIDVADEFGLEPLGSNLRICPFHTDKAPSLSLSKEKNIFNCFGCGTKGNIITFYGMLKKVKKNANN